MCSVCKKLGDTVDNGPCPSKCAEAVYEAPCMTCQNQFMPCGDSCSIAPPIGANPTCINSPGCASTDGSLAAYLPDLPSLPLADATIAKANLAVSRVNSLSTIEELVPASATLRSVNIQAIAAGILRCVNVVCVPLGQCYGTGVCDHGSGMCSQPTLPANTLCNGLCYGEGRIRSVAR